MPITYGVFPQSGEPSPKTVTTPTNPYHVSDHNRYDAALNEIKTKYNIFESNPRAWFAFNGINTPWAVIQDDVAYVSGIVTLGTSGTDPANTGGWNPNPIDAFGNGGTINAAIRGNWIRLGAFTVYVKVYVKVTSPWSGVVAIQIPFPSGWAQDVDEQILSGYCAHAGGFAGIHYPLLGIIHAKPVGSGGTLNGETSNPISMRFIVSS